MNNFKAVTSDINVFMKFAEKNGWEISCDLCPEDSNNCSNDCYGNLLLYLNTHKEDERSTSDISKEEFSKYYSQLKSVSSCTTSDYTGINYAINVMSEWKSEGKKLSQSQKEKIKLLEKLYCKKIDNLNRLGSIFKDIE